MGVGGGGEGEAKRFGFVHLSRRDEARSSTSLRVLSEPASQELSRDKARWLPLLRRRGRRRGLATGASSVTGSEKRRSSSAACSKKASSTSHSWSPTRGSMSLHSSLRLPVGDVAEILHLLSFSLGPMSTANATLRKQGIPRTGFMRRSPLIFGPHSRAHFYFLPELLYIARSNDERQIWKGGFLRGQAWKCITFW